MARLAYDGAATPIVVTSDPTFILLILGIVMVIISVNGALGPASFLILISKKV